VTSPTYKGVVFVIDDDEVVRLSTQDLLEDEGYLVLSARNGSEGLARMHGIVGPAVAIVDLVMPRIDGWHLIDTMRADANLRRIPIIVVSARREPVAGADRIVTKPLKTAELLRAVRELCR